MITYTIALVITSYHSIATYNMGEITGKLIIVINNRITYYPFEITSFNVRQNNFSAKSFEFVHQYAVLLVTTFFYVWDNINVTNLDQYRIASELSSQQYTHSHINLCKEQIIQYLFFSLYPSISKVWKPILQCDSMFHFQTQKLLNLT